MKQIKYNPFLSLIALALVALTGVILAKVSGEGSAIFAMASMGGMYSDKMALFRKNLSSQVEKETWIKSKFGHFLSFIDIDKYKKNGAFTSTKSSPKKPNEAIIHLVRDFAGDKHGLSMDVPFIRPITGKGVIGADTLEGKGEKRKIMSKKIAINMRRHAIMVRDNEISEMALTSPAVYAELLKNNAPELRDWFSRLIAMEPHMAIMYGSSHNLFDQVFGLGQNYSMKSHPIIYVRGAGQRVPFESNNGGHVANTFDAGYENAVVNSLATLTDDTSRHFNSEAVKTMIYLANKHRIPKVLVGGKFVHLIMIHPAQARQLRQDDDYIKAQHNAAVRGDNNPAFTGALDGMIYEGAILLVDETVPSARLYNGGEIGDDDFTTNWSTTGSNSGIQYGLGDNYLEYPRDMGPRKPAVLLGPGAVMAANAKDFKLSTVEKDHGQQIELGARMFYGMSRSDIIDDDNYMMNGAGKYYGNFGSFLFFTYSPDEVEI